MFHGSGCIYRDQSGDPGFQTASLVFALGEVSTSRCPEKNFSIVVCEDTAPGASVEGPLDVWAERNPEVISSQNNGTLI